MRKLILLAVLLVGVSSNITLAQDSTQTGSNWVVPEVFKAFATTRIVDMHSVETQKAHTMDFRISHRFGALNSGTYNIWGLDAGANILLSLDYSPTDWLMAGIGRSSYEKTWDGFLKCRILTQKEDGSMPLSVTAFSGMYYTILHDAQKGTNGYDKYEYLSSRFSFAHELIIARRFNKAFSFQIAPYFVHYNLVDHISDKNDVYGIQGGMRLKITKMFGICGEYAYNINEYSKQNYYDSFGLGVEIETGQHTFQILLTNSAGMLENQFLARTSTKWNNMGIRLGFNLSRLFVI